MILVFLSAGPQPPLWGAVMDPSILTVPQLSTAAPALPCQVLPSQALPSQAQTCRTEQMLLHLRLQSWFETLNPRCNKASLTSLQVHTPCDVWLQSRARGSEEQGNATNFPHQHPSHTRRRRRNTLRETVGICKYFVVFCLGVTIHTVRYLLQIGNGTSTQTIKAQRCAPKPL